MTALVTGSAGGIGRAIVTKLRAEGFDVKELDLVSGFDVSDPEAWEHIGSVDLACLNAGVLTGSDDIAALTDEQYRRAVGVNVDGVVYGVRRLDRVMPKGSTIVVTASLAGLVGIPDDPVYGLTKHAVVGFVRSVAPQLAERGIRIQAVCPGWADTALTPPEFKQELESRGFRLLTAEAVAEGVWAAYESEGTGEAWIVQPGREPLPTSSRECPGRASSVATRDAGVCEEPDRRDEAPRVDPGTERELEDTEARPVARLAVRPRAEEPAEALPPGSDDELAHSALEVEPSARVLRREALVVVVVPDEDDVGTRVDQRLPERRVLRSFPCSRTRSGGGASTRACTAPDSRRGRRGATSSAATPPTTADRRAVRVQRDQVPAPEVVAVVALRRIAGGLAEVVVVPRGAGRAVVVVPGNGSRDRLDPSPGGVVRRSEVGAGAVLVLDVAECQHGGVAGADEHVRRRALTARKASSPTVMERAVGGIAGDVSGRCDPDAGDVNRARRR